MQQVIAKYAETPEELNYPRDPESQIGLFDIRTLPNYRIYTREFSPDIVRDIAYSWFACFYAGCDDDEKSFLTVIKANLKVKAVIGEKIKDAQEFVNIFSQK